MTDCKHPVISTEEAEVAVGGLAGIAPAAIMRHALLVLDDDGDLHVMTSCCKHELPEVLRRAALMALADLTEPGACESGHHP
jgi:hypothetical protein